MDYNYARQPWKPYEPMFHALAVMNPTYDFHAIDVLCDRNNLRVLLDFVAGRAPGPFRLDLYSVFDTLVIVRNETKWWQHSGSRGAESYGCNFERFFTRPAEGMEDATSHYRAIHYPMGLLNVVCRFEADAYDDGVTDELTPSEYAAVSGGPTERPSFKFNAPFRVLQKGHIVPMSQMVELKTQRYRKDSPTNVTCQDQLWFGRTKLLYTAPYGSGTGVIDRVKYEDATARVKKWEQNNQENLRKLVALLTQLKAIMKAKKRPNSAVVLVREDKGGPLLIRSMESTNRAVGIEAFRRHWQGDAVQYNMPPANFRGQRGGGRGYVDRGRFGHRGAYGGQQYAPSYGQGYADTGKGGGYADAGQFYAPSYGQGYTGGGRGGGYGNAGQHYAPSYGQGYTGGARGGSYGNAGRGGGFSARGRGTGYDRGGYGDANSGGAAGGGGGGGSGHERGRGQSRNKRSQQPVRFLPDDQ
jgi:hypothetical protein